MSEDFDRREFIKIGAITCLSATALFGLFGESSLKKYFFQRLNTRISGKKYTFPVEILGPNFKIAHQMRELIPELMAQMPQLKESAQKTKTVILGGGIGGLSAGWWLKRNGYHDFQILELESTVGGNSMHGKSEISEFPWGAHYLPLPNLESKEVRLLLEEMGLLTGYDTQGRPLYEEQHLVADPEERLLKDGSWHEGLVPKTGISNEEQKEIDRFFSLMNDYKNARGQDGQPAFAIPVAYSSVDSEYTKLDQISFDNFLDQHGFHSKPLRWFLTYSSRDDYGIGLDSISAWAGIHYFAGRRGHAANAADHEVLTWPEGNGFFAKYFQSKLQKEIQTQQFVAKIEQDGSLWRTYFYDLLQKQWRCLESEHVIYALPQHTLKYLLHGVDQPQHTSHFAPWLVANIGLKKVPAGAGFKTAWDNVSYHSSSLGYIVATHQNLQMKPQETVVTYYQPLDHINSKEMREKMIKATPDDFVPEIIADLEKMHNGITDDILFVKAWLWGHGMISPIPNYIWSKDRHQYRQMLEKKYQGLHFAHSDQTGISIFEEAQYHGVQSARTVMKFRSQGSV